MVSFFTSTSITTNGAQCFVQHFLFYINENLNMKTLKNFLKEDLSSSILQAHVDSNAFDKAFLFDYKNREIDTFDLSTNVDNIHYELYRKEGKLWRIRAVKDFNISSGPSDKRLVKAGTLGGLIESEKNIKQNPTKFNNCGWVEYDACVTGNAIVDWNGHVFGKAKVEGNAQIEASVFGNAFVKDNAKISRFSEVYGDAIISGNAQIDSANVYGKARIENNAYVYDSHIFGNAIVKDDAKVSLSRVYDNAKIYDNAKVSKAQVFGRAQIFGHANVDLWDGNFIKDNAKVYGDVELKFDTNLSKNADVSGKGEINSMHITDKYVCQ